MARLGRGARFAAWIIVVAAAFGAAALARAEIPHARPTAASLTLAALSVTLWLLTTTPSDAVRLPALVSEALVFGGVIVLLLLATSRVGFSPWIAALAVIAGHIRDRPGSLWPRWRAAPWTQNIWRLSPALWHPAVWLTALHPTRSPLPWAGLGLCAAAGAGTLLVGRTAPWARFLGIVIWLLVGAMTVRLLW